MAKGRKKKSTGLGDIAAKVIDLAPESVVSFGKKVKMVITGSEECNCDEDQQKANEWGEKHLSKLFGTKTNTLTESEFDYLFKHLNGINKTNNMSIEVAKELIKISARVFNKPPSGNPSRCGNCMTEHINKLNKVFNEYELLT